MDAARRAARQKDPRTDLHISDRFDDQPGEPLDAQSVEPLIDADASPVYPHKNKVSRAVLWTLCVVNQ